MTSPRCGSSFLYNPRQSPEASIPKLDIGYLNMELCPTVRLGLNPVRNPTTNAPARVLLPKPRSLEFALLWVSAKHLSLPVRFSLPSLLGPSCSPRWEWAPSSREEMAKMFTRKQSGWRLDGSTSQEASECMCILVEVCYAAVMVCSRFVYTPPRRRPSNRRVVWTLGCYSVSQFI